MARTWDSGRLAIVAVALLLVGIAMRVSNALHYPIDLGFDAVENWSYISQLIGSWTLPAPDAGWSTSHPPLFYYTAAAISRALGRPEKEIAVRAIRLVNALLGLGVVAIAVAVVGQVAGSSARRKLLAAALLLFLPAHVLMSAMLSEEMMAAFFASLAVGGAAWTLQRPAAGGAWRQIGVGVAAGLALLTKLSGALALLAILASQVLDAWRQRTLRRAAGPIALLCVAALLAGGWYYARSWATYGYIYPFDLPAHAVMKTMPPGQRVATDYLHFPRETFSNPEMLAPGLLHSVWGGTYVTVWFDGHRHFLPREAASVRRAGSLILILALLPTAAFLVGLVAGARRFLRGNGAIDGLLVVFTVMTLAGYMAFTWRNPWFATVKGTYLLGLSVPFAFYASETLDRWMRVGTRRAWLVGLLLAALFVAVTAVFCYGLVFEKVEPPGLPWHPGIRVR